MISNTSPLREVPNPVDSGVLKQLYIVIVCDTLKSTSVHTIMVNHIQDRRNHIL